MLLSSSLLLDIIIFSCTVSYFIYKYFTRQFDYWKKLGVYYIQPLPIFGNFYNVVSFKTTIHEEIKTLYDSTDKPYFGIFMFDEPILVLKSPTLIKDVLIKDFNNFSNRSIGEPKHNPIINNFLFIQKNPAWKNTRSKLSPLFSSKMIKNMFTILEEINENFIDYLTKSSGQIDAKYVGSSFATEMIARCFYGVDPLCFQEQQSAFSQCVHKILAFTFRNAIVQNFYFTRPSWVELFKLDFVAQDLTNYFDSVFKAAMEATKDYDGKVRNLIDVMNQVKRNQNHGENTLDLNVVTANALLFLVAGQETTSSLVAYALYELALHQDIQNKLREDIKENVDKYGGVTFEGIQNIKYLDMVINETLRKYAALPFLDRRAESDYKFEGTDLVIKKGKTVYIPLYALSRDPYHFPDPESFNPDRFLKNPPNSDGLTFIPFGEGPRICIGKRLGLLTGAMAIVSVLLNFKLEKCESTPDPVKFEPKCFALQSKIGLPIKISPIF